MKFRKKPVVIEAIRWTGDNVRECVTFAGIGLTTEEGFLEGVKRLIIPTLEGNHAATPGDWIIRGIKGELYPCKPDIFEAIYEPVEEGRTP